MTTQQTRPAAPAQANEAERGARIIQLATRLMASGQARGWSHALELARKEVQ